MRISGRTYEEVYASFRWEIPRKFNLAEYCCFRHARATPDAVALIHVGAGGNVLKLTYARLADYVRRAGAVLGAAGIGRGDCIAIHLPQGPEPLILHLAAQMIGAVALPVFQLFGPDALRYRMEDSRAKLLVTSLEGIERIAPALTDLDPAPLILVADPASTHGHSSFWAQMEKAQAQGEAIDSGPDEPALLMYTSGTTGNPKGVLHAARVVPGHLPGVALPHEMAPQPGDCFWTPADWAWAGGLLDILYPALYWGLPVVSAGRTKFEPDWAFDFMIRHQVRNVFMPPTALRMMRQLERPAAMRPDLRSLGTGGEKLGEDMIAWGRETFDLTINEFYGQTEVNLVIGNCAGLFPVRAGSMGRPMPGHIVDVVDQDGQPVDVGQPGVVAVRRPDPVMFLEYWRRPEATREKFRGDWCLLGDVAEKDEEGYFWFKGRDDDIINTAGYRVGPGEVEECLATHPAVVLAGVIGAPDPVRGEVVSAFIVLADGYEPGPELEREIQVHVRERLAAHEYPRRIRFIDEMPLTVTGKIRRTDLRALERGDDSRPAPGPGGAEKPSDNQG